MLILAAALTACEGKKAQPPEPPKAPASAPAKAPEPPKTATTAAAPAGGGDVLAEGKKLYFTACANCHGPDGTGAMMRAMLPKIGDLTSAEMHGRMKDADIAALITTGRDKMPPFGPVFNPEQITKIIAYVRTLKK